MSTIFTRATVPDELSEKWLQHLRNFDLAHPGCHFQVIADAPNLPVEEMMEMLYKVMERKRFDS